MENNRIKKVMYSYFLLAFGKVVIPDGALKACVFPVVSIISPSFFFLTSSIFSKDLSRNFITTNWYNNKQPMEYDHKQHDRT